MGKQRLIDEESQAEIVALKQEMSRLELENEGVSRKLTEHAEKAAAEKAKVEVEQTKALTKAYDTGVKTVSLKTLWFSRSLLLLSTSRSSSYTILLTHAQ